MAGTTSVPSPTLTATGYVAPAESAILTGVAADINAAFGGAMTFGPGSSELALATSESAIIGDGNDQFLAVVAGADPATASGRMQDGVGRLYNLTRQPATATLVTCTCTGAVNRVIYTGSLAIDTSNNLYVCTAGGTIGSGGTISLPFASATLGPIPCPAGTLNRPAQVLPGWDAITNPADGVLGTNVESRAQFETRRQESLAANSTSVIGAIIGQVAAVSGVTDWYGYDNGAPTSVTVGGVTINANSIYVCVLGGSDAAVGQAILNKKPPGCGYTGSTTVTAYDSNPLYSAPVPYSVSFQRPTATPIYIAVTLENLASVPSNALALIQAVVLAAFAGTDNGPRARVGAKLLASRYIAGVAGLGPWAQIVSIAIGTSASPTSPSATMNINQNPTLASGNITLALV